jgi:hypothetical protein
MYDITLHLSQKYQKKWSSNKKAKNRSPIFCLLTQNWNHLEVKVRGLRIQEKKFVHSFF